MAGTVVAPRPPTPVNIRLAHGARLEAILAIVTQRCAMNKSAGPAGSRSGRRSSSRRASAGCSSGDRTNSGTSFVGLQRTARLAEVLRKEANRISEWRIANAATAGWAQARQAQRQKTRSRCRGSNSSAWQPPVMVQLRLPGESGESDLAVGTGQERAAAADPFRRERCGRQAVR